MGWSSGTCHDQVSIVPLLSISVNPTSRFEASSIQVRSFRHLQIFLVLNHGDYKATGKVITSVAAGSSKDVDIAVEAAKKARCHSIFITWLLSNSRKFIGVQDIVGPEVSRGYARKAYKQTCRPAGGKHRWIYCIGISGCWWVPHVTSGIRNNSNRRS